MKQNLFKRLISGTLALMLAASVIQIIPASAESDAVTNEAPFYPTGGVQADFEYITLEEAAEIDEIVKADYEACDVDYDKSLAADPELAGYKFSSDYYYNQLTGGKKNLYDALYIACEEFAESGVTLSTEKFSTGIDYNDIPVSDIFAVWQTFYYSNPQFFFLANAASWSYYRDSEGNDLHYGMVYPKVIPTFQDPAARAEYAANINTITKTWLNEIEKQENDLEKELLIKEKISDKVTYKFTDNDQSIAGALVDGECVCNGYALSAEYFLNACGIDTIIMTSRDYSTDNGHAWNMVNLFGTWYELDVTWYDTGGKSNDWINKSHNTFLSNDQDNSHVYDLTGAKSIFKFIDLTYPSCTSDTVVVPEPGVEISTVTFPDTAFRNYVQHNIDTDNDQKLSDAEIEDVKTLEVNNMGITSLQGIEYFSKLENLRCDCNYIESLDVSKNKNLVLLSCRANNLTDIDVSLNTELQTLDICNLVWVDDETLTYLEDHTNSISELDLRNNKKLVNLICRDNDLSSLDVSMLPELTHLSCTGNHLTSIDVTNNTELESLECHLNYIESLDLTNNPLLTNLHCDGNRLKTLDVSCNPELLYLFCNNNDITELKLSKNSKLEYLNCSENKLANIDVTANTALKTFICNDNVIDIGSQPARIKVSDIPGLDAGRVTEWMGAEYDTETGTIGKFTLDQESCTFLYKYDCGNGFTAVFGINAQFSTVPVVKAIPGDGEVTLTWEDVPGADKYLLTTPSGTDETPVSIEINDTFYTVPDLTNDTEYKFTITASVSGDWAWANEDDVNTVTVIPFSPVPVVTASADDGQITLSWNPVRNAEKYMISEIDPDGTAITVKDDITDTEFKIDGLINGKSYTYVVQSYINGQWNKTDPSQYVSAVPFTLIPAVTATPGNGQVTLSWEAIEGATKYFVSIVNADGTYKTVSKAFTGTTITVDDLTNGTEYTFLVQSYVNQKWSSSKSDYYVKAAPAAPEITNEPIVTATPGNGQVTLSWEAIEGATKYYVSIVNADGTYKTVSKALTGTTITVDDLTNGIEYTFLVQSYVNQKWSSSKSDYYVKATPVAPEITNEPVVTATPGDGQVTLTWEAIEGATKYFVSIVNTDGTYTTVSKAFTGTTITVDDLTNGTEYTFLVQSYVNQKWSSSKSDYYVKAAPVAPEITNEPIVTATPGDGQVTLSWEAIEGATKYYVSIVNADGTYKTVSKAFTGTTITVDDLTNGIEYTFLVQSYVNQKWSSSKSDYYVKAAPAAPEITNEPIVTATPGDGQVTLSWEAIEGATKYYVSMVNADGTYTTISKAFTGTTITVDDLINGIEYTFLVQSYVNKKWSSSKSDYYVKAAPAAPEIINEPIVTATPGDGQVTLSWEAIEGATKYYVSQVNSDGTYTTISKALYDTTITVDNLTNGIEYTFLVQSYVNRKWSSSKSDYYVKAAPVAPEITNEPIVTAAPGNGQVTLSWEAIEGATKYYVSIVNADGTYKTVSKAFTGTTITVDDLTNGIEYTFLVQSYVNRKWSSSDKQFCVSATPISLE